MFQIHCRPAVLLSTVIVWQPYRMAHTSVVVQASNLWRRTFCEYPSRKWFVCWCISDSCLEFFKHSDRGQREMDSHYYEFVIWRIFIGFAFRLFSSEIVIFMKTELQIEILNVFWLPSLLDLTSTWYLLIVLFSIFSAISNDMFSTDILLQSFGFRFWIHNFAVQKLTSEIISVKLEFEEFEFRKLSDTFSSIFVSFCSNCHRELGCNRYDRLGVYQPKNFKLINRI